MNPELETQVCPENAPAMRLQVRDEYLLGAIYEYGGVVAKRQLKEIFWPDKSWRAMEKRLIQAVSQRIHQLA